MHPENYFVLYIRSHQVSPGTRFFIFKLEAFIYTSNFLNHSLPWSHFHLSSILSHCTPTFLSAYHPLPSSCTSPIPQEDTRQIFFPSSPQGGRLAAQISCCWHQCCTIIINPVQICLRLVPWSPPCTEPLPVNTNPLLSLSISDYKMLSLDLTPKRTVKFIQSITDFTSSIIIIKPASLSVNRF